MPQAACRRSRRRPGRACRPRGGCPSWACRVTVLERDAAVGRHGQDHHASASTPSTTVLIRSTSAKPKKAGAIHDAIRPLFGDDPLDPDARHARAAAGQGVRLSARDAAGADGRQPAACRRASCSTTSMASIKSLIMPPRNEHSFEEWGVRNLGRTLYDLCFGIYSERVWGLPTSQISSKQAQRVAKLNLKNVVLRSMGIKAVSGDLLHEGHLPRARASACCSRIWPPSSVARGTAFISSHPWFASSATASGSRGSCMRTGGREHATECDGVALDAASPRSSSGMITPSLPRRTSRNTRSACATAA